MFGSGAGRAVLRSSQASALCRAAGRRTLTTAPPHATSRSWKNSALRWGIAAAGIYYYNTSPVFAEYPQSNLLNPNVDALEDGREHSTLDQLTASSRNKAQKKAGQLQTTIELASEDLAMQEQQKPNPSPSPQSVSTVDIAPETDGAADLEGQADQEGAFNPVTGEINWDCPCLGGMAYGPCGEQFKAAFSCFVYSNEEPKGMECIDKFQNMQDCFRAHPEVYRDEIEDNDDLDGELAQEKGDLQKEIAERRAAIEAQDSDKANRLLDAGAADPAGAPATTASGSGISSSRRQANDKKQKAPTSSKPAKSDSMPQTEAKASSHTPSEYSLSKETAHRSDSRILSDRTAPSVSAGAVPETDSLVPKAAHDATGAEGDTKSTAK